MAAELPSGTIGIPVGELTRFPGFWMCVQSTEAPPGSVTIVGPGLYLAENVNALMRDTQGDWLWLLNDDHLWPRETLMRLLARMYEHNLDILVPLCLQRAAPFKPVLWKEGDNGEYEHLDLRGLSGLIEADAVGGAGMLMRRRVFEALAEPVFEYGKRNGRMIGEDLVFCEKARAAGFHIHADLDVPFGHVGFFEVWPGEGQTVEVNIGGWETAINRSIIERDA